MSTQRLLGNPQYLHSTEMGSSSSVSSRSVDVPLVPAAALAWPLVALDAFRTVADETPSPAAGVLFGVAPVLNDTHSPNAGVLPLAAAILPPVAPVHDDTLPGIALVIDDTLHCVAPVHDDTLHPGAGAVSSIERAV